MHDLGVKNSEEIHPQENIYLLDSQTDKNNTLVNQHGHFILD